MHKMWFIHVQKWPGSFNIVALFKAKQGSMCLCDSAHGSSQTKKNILQKSSQTTSWTWLDGVTSLPTSCNGGYGIDASLCLWRWVILGEEELPFPDGSCVCYIMNSLQGSNPSFLETAVNCTTFYVPLYNIPMFKLYKKENDKNLTLGHTNTQT